jgi:hypothetical protein
MTVLGIDIGRSGAAPLLDESGAFVAIHHMPTLDDGPKGRQAVKAALLAGNIAHASATQAYVEHVSPRPTNGAMQGFVFGRCRGRPRGRFGRPRRSCDVPDAAAVETTSWHCGWQDRGEGRGALRSNSPLARQAVAIRTQELGRTRGSMPFWSHWAHAGGPAKGLETTSTVQRVMGSMARKTAVIDAMEKQIAESLVDQVRVICCDRVEKNPNRIPIPTANSTGRSLKRSWLQCERRGPSLGGQRNGGRSSRILLQGWNSP